jgi:hypothetical protein
MALDQAAGFIRSDILGFQVYPTSYITLGVKRLMSPATEKELEALGEAEVSRRIALHEYGVPGSEHRENVEAWLRSKALGASARKEAREEESLSISRKALANSRSATVIARIAITLSTIMAIQKVIEWYSIK